MGVEIYTMMATPFRMGGAMEGPVKTLVEEYERVNIGKEFFGILFKNPKKKLWHIGLESCGALIGTMESRAAVIKTTKNDVESGDEELMKVQIELGKRQLKQAEFMKPDQWFSRFAGKNRNENS